MKMIFILCQAFCWTSPPIRAQEYEKNQKTHPDNVMRMGWEHNQIMKS